MGRTIPSLTERQWRGNAQTQILQWINQKVPKLWIDRLWDEVILQQQQHDARIHKESDHLWRLLTDQVTKSNQSNSGFIPTSPSDTAPIPAPSAESQIQCNLCKKTMNSHLQLREHIRSTGHSDGSKGPSWPSITKRVSHPASSESKKHCKDSDEASTQNSEYLERFPEGTVLWNEDTWLRHPHNDWGHGSLKRNSEINKW